MKKIIFVFSLCLIFSGCNKNIDDKQEKNNNLQITKGKNDNNKNYELTENDNKDKDLVWNFIGETTWRKDNDWAGELYVFYVDNKNNQKCIRQVNGSGVYITSRNFVDFEIINNESIKIENDIFKIEGEKLISEKSELKLFSDKPLIYNWICGPIDMNFVRSEQFNVEDFQKECK